MGLLGYSCVELYAATEEVDILQLCNAPLNLEAKIKALNADGAKIIYSSRLIKPWMRAKEDIGDADLYDQLSSLLQRYGLTVALGAAGTLVIVSDPNQHAGTIEGRILDASGRRPVSNAIINVLGTAQTVNSNADGCFVIFNLEAGAYQLQISASHYQQETTATIQIDAKKLQRIVLKLKPEKNISSGRVYCDRQSILHADGECRQPSVSG